MTRYRLWLLAMVLFFLTYKEARLHRGLICEGAQFQIMTEAYIYTLFLSWVIAFRCVVISEQSQLTWGDKVYTWWSWRSSWCGERIVWVSRTSKMLGGSGLFRYSPRNVRYRQISYTAAGCFWRASNASLGPRTSPWSSPLRRHRPLPVWESEEIVRGLQTYIPK